MCIRDRRWCVDSSGGTLAPDRRLRKPDLRELCRAQMSFVCAEEFIELRRLDFGSGEHRVRLPAMMNLMLEEMGGGARRALAHDARTPHHRHLSLEHGIG